MRLIDADEIHYTMLYKENWLKGTGVEELAAWKKDIDNLPTIEERKKGKWLQKSKPLEFCTEWWYECSECGSKPPNDRYGHSVLLTDYCPNCGADMRGGEK